MSRGIPLHAGTKSWRDVAYEAIPKDQPMTRAVWLTACWADDERKRKVTPRTGAGVLAEKAIRQVNEEDLTLTMPAAYRGADSHADR